MIAFCASFASPGDTAYVKVFDKYHMGYNGNHDMKALAPPAARKNQRIWMKYTIGCTANGQCEWDYTIKLIGRQHTGKNDSTLKQAPSFKVIGGTAKDTVVIYRTDTTWSYLFNTTTKTADSVKTSPLRIAMFRDSIHPTVCTDTITVWRAGFYRYSYDTTGKKTDSSMVDGSVMRVKNTPYYSVFEIVNDYELGRMISPYAKTFPKTFAYEYMYDVTDFSSILHDSIEIRINYGGYSWGFTSTVEFYFVEGVPNREAKGLDILYNNYYNYGQGTSIEVALNSKKFTVPADASSVKLRVCVTGHGGEANENCAEFCAKYYYLKLNNKLMTSQLIWKDDCGSNAIMSQPGTWIYNRSNWCPGEKIRVWEYSLPVAPGSTDSIDMDLDPFTANGGAGYHITAYLVYYGSSNRTLDAGIEEIRKPSRNFWYSRINPICDNPEITLKNWGSDTLKSAEISYQLGDAAIKKFNWTGKLAMEKQVNVSLPYLEWSPDSSKRTFKVWISGVNGKDISNDENSYNNMMTSIADIPPVLPPQFFIETTTNSVPSDNNYTIKDQYGKTVYARSFTKASTYHRDTISLGLGCYTFEFWDMSGDGLSFWANSVGSGALRIRNAASPLNLLKTFNTDFGNFIRYEFTVMYKVGVDENRLENLNKTRIFPSPSNDVINIESVSAISKIVLMDLNGKIVYKNEGLGTDKIEVSSLPNGCYVLALTDDSGLSVNKKVIIAH